MERHSQHGITMRQHEGWLGVTLGCEGWWD